MKLNKKNINILWEEVIASVQQQLMQIETGEMQVNICLIPNHTWKFYEVHHYKCHPKVQANQEFVHTSKTHRNRNISSKAVPWRTTKFLHETPLKLRRVITWPHMLTFLAAQPSVKDYHSSVLFVLISYQTTFSLERFSWQMRSI